MLLRVGLYGLTFVGVTLADAVVAVLVGASWVLASSDVDRLSFPYSRPCSPRKPDIVLSSSSVASGSWRLLLIVCILRQLPLFL